MRIAGLFLLAPLAGLAAENLTPATLWRSFASHPGNHAQIPDNSYAGYHYGEGPFQIKKTADFVSIKKLGAKGDGLSDDTSALQSAFDGGGKIFLPEGIYRVTSRLTIRRSHTQILGAGTGKTKIVFEKPLSAIEPETEKFKYSWNGGLLHIGPAEDFLGGLIPEEEDRSGWHLGEFLGPALGQAARGERKISVEKPERFRPGQWIFLSWPPEEEILRFIAGLSLEAKFNWKANGKVWFNKWLRWPVQVAEVGKSFILLRQPLRIPIEKKWTIKIHALDRRVEEVKLSGFSIDFKSGRPHSHNQELGFNGLFFHRTVHSAATDIVIQNADSAVLLDGTKNVTLSRIKIRGRRQFHHAFFGKNNHDTLVSDFEIQAPTYHGLNADIFGSGNVWRKGKMAHGTFDMHRGMQFDLLRTDITLHNDGVSGGTVTNGPMQGGRVVHWNIRYTGSAKNVAEPALHPQGALVGIQGIGAPARNHLTNGCLVTGTGHAPAPADLYEAQLKLRRKRESAPVSAAK